MPRISSLAARAAATPPIPEGPTPEQPGLTLSAPSGKLKEYLVAGPLNVEPPGGKINYLVVFHPMAQKAEAIRAVIPNIQEGQVVVLLADGRILPVARLHLVHAVQFWTDLNYTDGEVLEVTQEKPGDETHLVDHIETLVLCYTPAGVVAAKATWRKTRSPFAKTMAAAEEEKKGQWQEITGAPVVEGRTNKKTSKEYTVVTARVSPINSEEARALVEWAANPDTQREFKAVADAYEERIRLLQSKAR